MTLDPLKHLDVVGTLMILLVGYGWAKPVPVNPRNFRKIRRDDTIVSLAGVFTNFVLAFLFMGVFVLIQVLGVTNEIWLTIVNFIVYVNIGIGIFNLIPIPPLDGYHVLNDLILRRPLFASQRAMMLGQIVLIALVFTGVFGRVLGAVTDGVMAGVGAAFEALFRLLHII
jgi:Zn-dependent protease